MKMNKVLTKKWDKFPYIGHGLTGGIEVVLSLMIITLGVVDFMLFHSRVDADTRQVPDTPHKFLFYFLSPGNHSNVLYTHQMLTLSGAPTWSGLWLLVTGSVGTFIGWKRRKLTALRFTEMIYFIMNLISALVLSPLACYIVIAVAYFRYKLDIESKSLIWLLPLVLAILIFFQLLFSILAALVCYCSDRRFSPVHILVKKKDLEKLSELKTTGSSIPKPEVKDMGHQTDLQQPNTAIKVRSEDKEIQTSGLTVTCDTAPVVAAPAPAPVLQPQIAYPTAPPPIQNWGNFPQQPSNSSTQVNIYLQDIAGKKANNDSAIVDEGSKTPTRQIKGKTCEMAAQTDNTRKSTPSIVREIFPKSPRRVQEKLVQTYYIPEKSKPLPQTRSYVVGNDFIDEREVQKQDDVLRYEDVSENEDEKAHVVQHKRRNDAFAAPPPLVETQTSIIRESTKPTTMKDDDDEDMERKSPVSENIMVHVSNGQKGGKKHSEGTPIVDDTVLYDLEELNKPNDQIKFDNKQGKTTEEARSSIEESRNEDIDIDLKKQSMRSNTEKISMGNEEREKESSNGVLTDQENSSEAHKSADINASPVFEEPNEDSITKPTENANKVSNSSADVDTKVSFPNMKIDSSKTPIEKMPISNVKKSNPSTNTTNIESMEKATEQNIKVGDKNEQVTLNAPAPSRPGQQLRHLHVPQKRDLPLEDSAVENVSKRINGKQPQQISVQPLNEGQSRSPSSNKSYSMLRKLIIPQR